MDTRIWGPPTWECIFNMAAGYDVNTLPQGTKNKAYKNWFQQFEFILPCKYCRESYKFFFKELNIDNYFNRKYGMLRFAYDLKDKVNTKLINQESERQLKKLLELNLNDKNVKQKSKKIIHDHPIYTKKSPPFEKIIKKYVKGYGKCSDVEKRCSRSN